MIPPLGRKWIGTKETLDESERKSEKAGLKLNIKKTKIMPSSPFTSWQTDGEAMETVRDFIFGGSASGIKLALATKVKEESEKAGLKLNIKKTKMMAPGPITLWQRDGEIVEAVIDFIFLGSKITANDECSHEIKRCLLLGRKVMTNLDSILKSRDITLLTKVHQLKVKVFPVVMYGC